MAPLPRAVLVTRPTEYEALLTQHGTRGQAEFFLRTRGKKIDEISHRNETFHKAKLSVLAQVPEKWRRAQVGRDEIDRFQFEEDDLIIALGPDGLVANTAKYLSGQTVIGINPSPELFDGVLVKHRAEDAGELLHIAQSQSGQVQARTMVEASLDDGQRIVALNEVFVGHQSHQSARYDISALGQNEYHSSSGLIALTGTGATGWGRSIHRAYKSELAMPLPEQEQLAFFVREAFPSNITGTTIKEGIVSSDLPLQVTSRMDAGGVIFGDGIETDYLVFLWGQTVHIRPAEKTLNLLIG